MDSKNIVSVAFQLTLFGSLYFDPLATSSLNLAFSMAFRSSMITWPFVHGKLVCKCDWTIVHFPSWWSSHSILYKNSLFIYLRLCIMTQVIFIYSNTETYVINYIIIRENINRVSVFSSSIYKVRVYDISNVHVHKAFLLTICTKLQWMA